jgi:sugar phosphate isomerase/epimerase
MIKQSFCFPNFRQAGQPLLELFEAARAIGYPAVELWQRDANDAPFVDVVAAARASGLVIASMCGHYALKDGMNKRANHARIAA